MKPEAQELVPDVHIEGKKNPPMTATTDLALIADPEFRRISRRFYDDPEYFATSTPAPGSSCCTATDVESFGWMELRADGFRNWIEPGSKLAPETLRIAAFQGPDRRAHPCIRPCSALTPARQSHHTSLTENG